MRLSSLALGLLVFTMPAHAQTTAEQQASPRSDAGSAAQEFVTEAAVGNRYEIQSSNLASRKSLGEAFNTYVQQNIADHTDLEARLITAAKSVGATIPTELDTKHNKMIEKLRSASDAEFGELFRSQQIDSHEEAIRLYQAYSQSGENDELRKFVESTLPVLRRHLQVAQNLTQEPKIAGQSDDRQKSQRQIQGLELKRQVLSTAGPDHFMASELPDTDVYGANGEEIGEVHDVLMNRKGEGVAIIVSVGGFLGLGEKYVAVPLDAVQINATGEDGEKEPAEPNRVVLHGMSRQELEDAPNFATD